MNPLLLTILTPLLAAHKAAASGTTQLSRSTTIVTRSTSTVTAKIAALFNIPIPNHWPDQGDLLSWCQNMGPGLAAMLILFGVVYLLFGYTIFKALIVLNAACLGFVVGAALGDRCGAPIPLAIVGAVLTGAVTLPLMKHAVAVTGATYGALVGMIVWRLLGLEPNYAWSGAMIGMVGCGLLCFILFRGCVVMFMSLQGSTMLIFGILGLILKYQDLSPRVAGYLISRPFLLPMCVFVPTVVGMLYQQTLGAPTPSPSSGSSSAKK